MSQKEAFRFQTVEATEMVHVAATCNDRAQRRARYRDSVEHACETTILMNLLADAGWTCALCESSDPNRDCKLVGVNFETGEQWTVTAPNPYLGARELAERVATLSQGS